MNGLMNQAVWQNEMKESVDPFELLFTVRERRLLRLAIASEIASIVSLIDREKTLNEGTEDLEKLSWRVVEYASLIQRFA